MKIYVYTDAISAIDDFLTSWVQKLQHRGKNSKDPKEELC